MGCGGIAPLILKVKNKLHAQVALPPPPPQKKALVSSYLEDAWAQEAVWTIWV